MYIINAIPVQAEDIYKQPSKVVTAFNIQIDIILTKGGNFD